jgi:hypothetical protein
MRVLPLFALLCVWLLSAQAEDDPLPPIPKPNPERVEGTLPRDARTVPWTASEIEAAKAECKKVLAAIALDYEMLPPIKEGLCGAPAPIRLKSVGNDPKVVIEPAATVTCALAVSLDIWLKERVQPEAHAAFGAKVTKLQNVSSYTCRNRNGGANTLLSEHALANALDISEFVLESGLRIAVLDSWPRLVSDEPPSPMPNPLRLAEVTAAIAPPLPEPKPLPPVSRKRLGGGKAPEVTKARAPAPPVPPPVAKPLPPKPLSERKAAFVRAVHDEACKSFGTVLGPDADEAHKSHFHLDMRSRRSGLRLCQ